MQQEAIEVGTRCQDRPDYRKHRVLIEYSNGGYGEIPHGEGIFCHDKLARVVAEADSIGLRLGYSTTH